MDVRFRFSERTGFAESGMSVDVPQVVRLGILDVACECGVQFGILRNVLWRELRHPSSGGTSTADLLEESRELIRQCDWLGVYDTAEALYDVVAHDDGTRAQRFEIELNRLFRFGRIAFEMADGRISVCPGMAKGLQPGGKPLVLADQRSGATHRAEAFAARSYSAEANSRETDSDRGGVRGLRKSVEWLVGVAGRPGTGVVLNVLARVVRFILTWFRSVDVR